MIDMMSQHLVDHVHHVFKFYCNSVKFELAIA